MYLWTIKCPLNFASHPDPDFRYGLRIGFALAVCAVWVTVLVQTFCLVTGQSANQNCRHRITWTLFQKPKLRYGRAIITQVQVMRVAASYFTVASARLKQSLTAIITHPTHPASLHVNSGENRAGAVALSTYNTLSCMDLCIPWIVSNPIGHLQTWRPFIGRSRHTDRCDEPMTYEYVLADIYFNAIGLKLMSAVIHTSTTTATTIATL